MKKLIFIYCLLGLTIVLQAQHIKVFKSSSQTDIPNLEWIITDIQDSISELEIFRAPHDAQSFEQIETQTYFFSYADTLLIGIVDTTLTQKGVWQYYIRIPMLEKDTINSDIMFAHNMGYLAAPEVYHLQAQSAQERKAIELNWEVRNPATILSQSIYRSRNYDDGFELVTRLGANARSFTDEVSRANEPWFYFIMIHDYFGYQPPSTRVYGISTYAEAPLTPYGFTAIQNGKDVVLNWEKTSDNTFSYRIYRRENGKGKFYPVGEPFYLPGDKLTRTDSHAINDSILSLEYYCTAISDGYIESLPTDTAYLYFPENIVVIPPAEFDYVMEPDGQIRLFWTAADVFSNIIGYNLFKVGSDSIARKINAEPIMENSFLDKPDTQEEIITYQVESLNPAGKPSALRTSITVERSNPQYQLLLSYTQKEDRIMLEWIPLRLEGIKQLHMMRQSGDEDALLLAKIPNERAFYTDQKVKRKTTYVYTVVAEMEDGRQIMVNSGLIVRKF
ncbi:MAG: hypothetical protein M0Q41_06225 [Bacteroidales bacterium]|nr:hypothetical protein [Bacteroidales bacterium]